MYYAKKICGFGGEPALKKIKKVVDRTLILYLIIGIVNFLLCTGLMFFLFNFCGFNDHVAPLCNYTLGSLIWFLSCKYIVFRGHESSWKQIARFVLEVAACYLLSYYVVAPLCAAFLLQTPAVQSLFSFGGNSQDMIDGNFQMTVGAVAYAIINYFGQRYFVFTDRFEHFKGKEKQKIKQ